MTEVNNEISGRLDGMEEIVFWLNGQPVTLGSELDKTAAVTAYKRYISRGTEPLTPPLAVSTRRKTEFLKSAESILQRLDQMEAKFGKSVTISFAKECLEMCYSPNGYSPDQHISHFQNAMIIRSAEKKVAYGILLADVLASKRQRRKDAIKEKEEQSAGILGGMTGSLSLTATSFLCSNLTYLMLVHLLKVPENKAIIGHLLFSPASVSLLHIISQRVFRKDNFYWPNT